MRTLQENQSLNLEYQRNKELRELKDQLQQKENIIKEVREYIMTNGIHSDYGDEGIDDENKLLEILDKGSEK